MFISYMELPDEETGYKYYYKGNQRIRQEEMGGGGTTTEGFIYSCDVKSEALTGGIVEAVFLNASNNEIGSQLLEEISGTNDWIKLSGNIPEDNFPSGTFTLKLRVRRESGSGRLWVGDMSIDIEEGQADQAYNYFYDNAGNLIMVVDDNEANPPIRYIYAGNRLLATEKDGSLYFYHLNRLGSPIMITDENGNVAKEKQYEAFGNLVWEEGTLDDNREFTGKEKDPTGFHYFGARYYYGNIGRFLTPDPHTLIPWNLELPYPQTLNPYVYCTNDPLTFLDPNGLFRTAGNIAYHVDFIGWGSFGQATASILPLGELPFLLMRETTGDQTVTWRDWAFATTGAALYGAGNIVEGLETASDLFSGVSQFIPNSGMLGYVCETVFDDVFFGMINELHNDLNSGWQRVADLNNPKTGSLLRFLRNVQKYGEPDKIPEKKRYGNFEQYKEAYQKETKDFSNFEKYLFRHYNVNEELLYTAEY